MEPTLNRPKPWMLPFWFMLGILVFNSLENFFFVFPVIFGIRLFSLTWDIVFLIMIWPSILIAEAVVYWRIRKRIHERKWVWAHLLFSLFAFVLQYVFHFSILLIVNSVIDGIAFSSFLLKMNLIKFYTFWGNIIIGHVFFIVTIVRSFSAKKLLLSNDTNDLLGEVAGSEH